MDLGDIECAGVASGGHPGRRLGRRRLGEVACTEHGGFDTVLDSGDPGRVFAQPTGAVAGREHDRCRAIGDGCDVVAAQRVVEERPGQQLVDALCRLLGVVPLGLCERFEGDLSHLLVSPLAGVQPDAGLQPGQRHRVRPQRRHGVGVGLPGQDLTQDPCRGLPEAVHQRGVDLAGEDLDVGLVKGPGGVHFDVRLVDRRNGADRVDRRDE